MFCLLPIIVQLHILTGYELVILYIMQGLGRAVYESINRAIFGDFYGAAGRDEHKEAAFANIMIQNAGVSCAFFFVNFAFSKDGVYATWAVRLMEILMVVFGLSIVPCYLWALRIRDKEILALAGVSGGGGRLEGA